MKFDHGARVNIAILLLVASAFISNIRYVKFAALFSPSRVGKDNITLYEKKLSEIKKDLKPYSIVGYIADRQYRNIGLERDAAGYLYITRYALSPLIIDETSTDYPVVIGNFLNIPAGRKNASGLGLVLIKDYGNGLMLFKRKP